MLKVGGMEIQLNIIMINREVWQHFFSHSDHSQMKLYKDPGRKYIPSIRGVFLNFMDVLPNSGSAARHSRIQY